MKLLGACATPGNALTHEMAHLLQQVISGWTDYDHVEKWLWEIADGN